jgi:hypothetical protein
MFAVAVAAVTLAALGWVCRWLDRELALHGFEET